MTFVLVLFSWVLFRSNTIGGAMGYVSAMLGGGTPADVPRPPLGPFPGEAK